MKVLSSNNSGAMNAGVPATLSLIVAVVVNVFSSSQRESPKSVTLHRPSCVSSTLWVFKSRCSILQL